MNFIKSIWRGGNTNVQSTADVLGSVKQALTVRDELIVQLRADNKTLQEQKDASNQQVQQQEIQQLQADNDLMQKKLDRAMEEKTELEKTLSTLSRENEELKKRSEQTGGSFFKSTQWKIQIRLLSSQTWRWQMHQELQNHDP